MTRGDLYTAADLIKETTYDQLLSYEVNASWWASYSPKRIRDWVLQYYEWKVRRKWARIERAAQYERDHRLKYPNEY